MNRLYLSGALMLACCQSLFAGLTPPACTSLPANFHVSTDGSPQSAGTMKDPWDLQTALDHPNAVLPGDRIWIHAGVYQGTYVSRLQGSAAAPILVRAFNGEPVTLDGGDSQGAPILSVEGAHTWFWDLEITSTDPQRSFPASGAWTRGPGIVTGAHPGDGVGARFINLIIHDAAAGIVLGRHALDALVYGCLIYHNGGEQPGGGRGPGLTGENAQSTKQIVENIFFGGYGGGIDLSGTPGVSLDGFRIMGNVLLQAGALSAAPSGYELLVSSQRPIQDLQLEANFTYQWDPARSAARLGRLGVTGANVNSVVRTNYFAGGVHFIDWRQITFTQNVVVAPQTVVTLEQFQLPTLPPYVWEQNAYYCQQASAQPFQLLAFSGGGALSFVQWRLTTGFDELSTYNPSPPLSTAALVRPNLYDPERTTIVIYNWPRQPEVAVDVSRVLLPGDAYELRDAQNYFAAPLAAGVYDGAALVVPMDLAAAAQAVGEPAQPYTHTAPDFGVFILQRTQPAAARPGDCNCDGFIDNEDIWPFLMAVRDPVRYRVGWPPCPISNADMNRNGLIDCEDLDQFLSLLTPASSD